MNKETRIQKIQAIIDRDKSNPFGKIEIPWEDSLITKEVYKIPLEYLVYNKYNGRILSRTQSLEKQNHVIDGQFPFFFVQHFNVGSEIAVVWNN